MATNALVQTRINREVKDEATVVLAAMGLTVSEAVRILLTRIANEKAFPFEPLVPSETTLAAMREARSILITLFTFVDEIGIFGKAARINEQRNVVFLKQCLDTANVGHRYRLTAACIVGHRNHAEGN